VISDFRLQNADWRIRTAAALLACCAMVLAYSSGPPDSKTGRPGEGTCNDCHSGVGSADSTEITGFAGGWYTPDSLYSLTLSVRYAGQRRWGFELTVVDQTNNSAGQLIVTESTNTQYSSAPPGYLKHTSTGTYPGTPGPTDWTFGWRAPAAGAGAVRFYWCANAADTNGSTSGDRICRDSLVVNETGIAEPGKAQACRFFRYANPARDRVVIRSLSPTGSPVRIYSTSGRLVRSIPVPQSPAGTHQPEVIVTWDGRDDSGRLVPAASYLVQIGKGARSTVRVELAR
jgi:hypothetical protein